MNYCTEEDLQRFDKIDAKKKICFLTEKREDLKSAIYFKSCKGQNEIKDDTTEYCRYVSLKKLINSKSACGNNFES